MEPVTLSPVMTPTWKARVPLRWAYDAGDPSIVLFTALAARCPLTVEDGGTVAELGSAETDWQERIRPQNPGLTFMAIDARKDRDVTTLGDATNPWLFPLGSLDAVVMLGALEHFGLGFYGDPVVEDGDIRTMQNVARWLKPGGWVYFDVPCNPTDYITENRHFRVFSPEGVTDRLIVPGLREVARIYSTDEPLDGVSTNPPAAHRVPYHYCAVIAERVHGPTATVDLGA